MKYNIKDYLMKDFYLNKQKLYKFNEEFYPEDEFIIIINRLNILEEL